jgi:hypothetical protein
MVSLLLSHGATQEDIGLQLEQTSKLLGNEQDTNQGSQDLSLKEFFEQPV